MCGAGIMRRLQLLRVHNLRVSLCFEPRDLWVGVYWDKADVHPSLHGGGVNVFICVLPMLPIVIEKYWFKDGAYIFGTKRTSDET